MDILSHAHIDHLRVLAWIVFTGGAIAVYLHLTDNKPKYANPIASLYFLLGSFMLGALLALVLTCGILGIILLCAFMLGFV